MIQQIQFRAMGCHVTAIVDDPSSRTKQALMQVPGWFEDWEQSLSRFRKDSELSQLNRSEGKPFLASETLWEVTRLALLAVRSSDGLVNPAILPALMRAGYTDDFDRMRHSPKAVAGDFSQNSINNIPNVSNIYMDATDHVISIPQGMQLDYGGIAKGWAAQRAAERLRAFGPSLVNVGGDLFITAQPRHEQAWKIGIRDPLSDNHEIERIYVRLGGVATSGKDYRKWAVDGQMVHHIIDPRTGQPADTDVLSVTVIAPTTLLAEISTKVILILGSEKGLEWIKEKPDHAALIITDDQTIKMTRNFHPYTTCQTQEFPKLMWESPSPQQPATKKTMHSA
jgi:thiamine biosynthesis lipoprotein